MRLSLILTNANYKHKVPATREQYLYQELKGGQYGWGAESGPFLSHFTDKATESRKFINLSSD